MARPPAGVGRPRAVPRAGRYPHRSCEPSLGTRGHPPGATSACASGRAPPGKRPWRCGTRRPSIGPHSRADPCTPAWSGRWRLQVACERPPGTIGPRTYHSLWWGNHPCGWFPAVRDLERGLVVRCCGPAPLGLGWGGRRRRGGGLLALRWGRGLGLLLILLEVLLVLGLVGILVLELLVVVLELLFLLAGLGAGGQEGLDAVGLLPLALAGLDGLHPHLQVDGLAQQLVGVGGGGNAEGLEELLHLPLGGLGQGDALPERVLGTLEADLPLGVPLGGGLAGHHSDVDQLAGVDTQLEQGRGPLALGLGNGLGLCAGKR